MSVARLRDSAILGVTRKVVPRSRMRPAVLVPLRAFLLRGILFRLRVLAADRGPRIQPSFHVFRPVPDGRADLSCTGSNLQEPPPPDGRHGQASDARYVMFIQ